MDDSNTEPVAQGRKGHSPPYVAYRTFKNFLDSLRQAMPSRIDRSVMHTMSGAAQSHIMAALKSMDLISKQGIPTETFRQLAQSDGEDRKRLLATVLRVGFPFLFDDSIDLATATGKQLLEKFEHTPLSGNTERRAVAFFLAAGKDAGLPLSPFFAKIQSRSGTPANKRNGSGSGGLGKPSGAALDDMEDFVEEDDAREKPGRPGESLTVELQSGGKITLTASTSFVKMSANDRAFVFDIIDRLQQYGKSAQ
jgi:hypothetical protein